MKKLMALVLALCCVLGLGGCDKTAPDYVEPNFTEQPVIEGNLYSDFEGISARIGGLYVYPDKTTLTVTWINRTEHPAIYGKAYWIERLENSEWVTCALKENIFATVAYELRAGEMDNMAYTITDMYDISTPGTYRFLSTCSVDVGEEKQTDCSLWAEFIIE